jgi:hypothetical protein
MIMFLKLGDVILQDVAVRSMRIVDRQENGQVRVRIDFDPTGYYESPLMPIARAEEFIRRQLHRGTMNLAPVLDAFYDCCLIWECPDEVRGPQALADTLMKRYDAPSDIADLRFNGVRVIIDPSLEPNIIELRNIQHPDDPKYNVRIILNDDGDETK